MPLTATKAIKTYIESGGDDKVGAREMLDLKNSCPPAEYQELGRQAAEALGEEFAVAEVTA